MDSEFLPGDYKVPQNSGYMKLQDGENTFRVLGSAVIGWEYWNTANKPVRLRKAPTSTPEDIREKDGKPEQVKHFWAFPVWNYAADAVQILSISQNGIQSSIKALVDNKKWGDPRKYDITITRSGSGFDTEYTVMPNPHTELTKEIKDAAKARPVNLEALFDGADPFEVKVPNRAEGEVSVEEQPE